MASLLGQFYTRIKGSQEDIVVNDITDKIIELKNELI